MLHGHQHVRYREGGAAMKTKQKTFVFASLFADDIQGMVEYKAALGHKCESYAWALQTFDRYCLSHHRIPARSPRRSLLASVRPGQMGKTADTAQAQSGNSAVTSLP